MKVNVKGDAIEIVVQKEERKLLRETQGLLTQLARYADVNEGLAQAGVVVKGLGVILDAIDGDGVIATRDAKTDGKPELKQQGTIV